jgi:uncharacterized protein (DUF3820 family)
MNDRLMAFGKYKGKPISTVPLDYLQWCYDNFEDGKRRTLLQIEIERRQRLCPEHLKADRQEKTTPFAVLTGPKKGKAGQQGERIAYPQTMSRPALSKKERKRRNRERERQCPINREFREIIAVTPPPIELRLTQGAYAGKLISELPESYVRLMARHADTDTSKQCADYLNRKRKPHIAPEPEIRKAENWIAIPPKLTASIEAELDRKFANVAIAKSMTGESVTITPDECPY